jgi:hypothetical protein
MPPSNEEVQSAVSEKRFQSECNDNNQHLGDREWHVERIAYFVAHPCKMDAITVKKSGDVWDIENGAHRLIAATILGWNQIAADKAAST